jgi:energy-coupling factor transporter ATP-binding protein EcfA2
VQKCPFDAIMIINLPKNLEKETTHRYGPNSFKLHRLPIPRPGQVLGLVGTNGIGKSTALKVLAGKLKPNLGRFEVCMPQPAHSPCCVLLRCSQLLVFPGLLAFPLAVTLYSTSNSSDISDDYTFPAWRLGVYLKCNGLSNGVGLVDFLGV